MGLFRDGQPSLNFPSLIPFYAWYKLNLCFLEATGLIEPSSWFRIHEKSRSARNVEVGKDTLEIDLPRVFNGGCSTFD